MSPLNNNYIYRAVDWLYVKVFGADFQDRRCWRCGQRRFEHVFGQLRSCRPRRKRKLDSQAVDPDLERVLRELENP